LDQNVTLLGRVLKGIELLSTLPRGTGPMGFYEKPEQHVPIKSIRVAADVAEADRTNLEVLRTDLPIFTQLIESRRNRQEEWFDVPGGHIDVCNVPLPVRPGVK
jgi:peptidylprolyl isomerase